MGCIRKEKKTGAIERCKKLGEKTYVKRCRSSRPASENKPLEVVPIRLRTLGIGKDSTLRSFSLLNPGLMIYEGEGSMVKG